MGARQRGLGSVYRRKKRMSDGTTVELPKWWIKYYRNGRAFREPTGTAKYSLALKKLKRRIQEIEDGTFAGRKADRLRIAETRSITGLIATSQNQRSHVTCAPTSTHSVRAISTRQAYKRISSRDMRRVRPTPPSTASARS